MRLTYLEPRVDLSGKLQGAFAMIVCPADEEALADEVCGELSRCGYDKGEFFRSDSLVTYYLQVESETDFIYLRKIYKREARATQRYYA